MINDIITWLKQGISWRMQYLTVPLLKGQLGYLAAFIWRRLHFNTTFIAVAGSVGKTTTTEFLGIILERWHPTLRTLHNRNLIGGGIQQTILRVRPWHKFAVIEVGIEKPNDMQLAAKLLKPDIAIMLGVKHCHTDTFKTLQNIAEEKSKLLRRLNHNGIAIINQDDSYVSEMALHLKCKIIRFGSGQNAEFRLCHAESRWPDRLKLKIEVDKTIYEIETRLVGTHWVPTIMASLAAANTCGMPIEKSIDVVKSIDPFLARMQPTKLIPYGATILRDEWNGSIDTFESAIKVMEEAKAVRKIVVFSDCSDLKKRDRVRANYLGRVAARIADMAIFIGDHAVNAARAAASEDLKCKHAHSFFSISPATDFLKKELRDGDLVLIKGKTSDHLSRVYHGLLGEINCLKSSCSYQFLCDGCNLLGLIINERTSAKQGLAAGSQKLSPPLLPTLSKHPVQAVVGLGNVGKKYEDTPHNVGQRALNLLAHSLRGEWIQVGQAMVASIKRMDEIIYLIRLLVNINESGPVLAQLSNQLEFGPTECILIHDDTSLPLGNVRTSIRGSDGGHKGVRSIIQEFQTVAIRRVKIGVGQPERQDQLASYVVTPFSSVELPAIESACAKAAEYALRMVEQSFQSERRELATENPQN